MKIIYKKNVLCYNSTILVFNIDFDLDYTYNRLGPGTKKGCATTWEYMKSAHFKKCEGNESKKRELARSKKKIIT